jgi:hypothetical protein
MNMAEFAQDPTAPGVAGTLAALAAAEPRWRWAALIDTAFDYLKRQPPPFAAEALNCYSNNEMASLNAAAPVLVPLPPEAFRARAETLIRHCSARPMLSFIAVAADFPLEKLVKQWEPLHRLHGSDNQKFLLRFADTRALATLPKVLKPEQWWTWHQNIVSWRLPDRNGYLTQLALEAKEHPPVRRMEIDDGQLARMLALSEADAMLNFIVKTNPDLLPAGLTGYGYFTMASKVLAKADRHGIEAWSDRVTLVGAALMTHGELWETPESEKWLAAKGWTAGKMAEAIETPEFPWPTSFREAEKQREVALETELEKIRAVHR